MSRDAAALVEAFERLTAAAVRRRGLDAETLAPTQRVALAALVAEGSLRLRALAERIGTTDATASRTVDALATAGLAERTAAPDDRRGIVVRPTAAGRRLLASRRRQLESVLEPGLASLPAEDRARLVGLLDELTRLLEPA
ncbi:MAG TPA: MarR family transcriptional regulator [Gaiellaceae bacterium]|nr:MarR family transcriptional regulator [Gaiellaceae bacterium]